jgi:hypothetical protein
MSQATGLMMMLTAATIAMTACRAGGDLASREERPGEQRPREAQTASPYSTGTDSGAKRQRVEGTNLGVGFEGTQRIPGVIVTLNELEASGRAPSKENLTALRGQLGTLEDGMRDDFRRVGLADTGAFHALTDSIAHQMGGGPGGTAKHLSDREFAELSGRVRRLISVYQSWVGTAQR